MKNIVTKCMLAGALLTSSALYANETSNWQHELTVYGWLPTLDGTLTFKVPGEPDDSTDSNAIDSLDSVFMGSYEARKNEWSFLADVIYLKMSGDTQGLNPNINLDLELTAKMFAFYGGYNLSDANNMRVDVIGGMRYFSLGLDVTRSGGRILNGTLSSDIENYDAVIGIKGEYTINADWYIPYQFDIGGGDSDLTWQANASLAYRFDWGDVIATYRYMHYDKGDSLLLEDFNLYGPKLGVVFHF
jgi:hypothetical protein